MEEEKNKKKMIVAIIGAIILVAGIVGLTYAYFRAQAQSKDIVVSSRKLSIVFSDPEGSLIRASDIEPIADADIESKGTKKTFTIAKKSANDKDVYLRLELTDLVVSDNFKDSDLRWALYKSESLVTEGSFVNVKDSTSLPLANNILLDSTTPTEYNLYIWIHETGVDQERLMGGSLSGKITVTGTENTQEGIVNEGKLADGMIPVVYDETNNVWVKAGGDLGWYDYSKQEWANIATVEGTNPTSTCTEWDKIKGDVSGPEGVPDEDLSKEDADKISDVNAGSPSGFTDEEWLRRADFDGNGIVNNNDAFSILTSLNSGSITSNYCNTDNSTSQNTKNGILESAPGTPINIINIERMYTWIPRYKYKINNTGTNALPSMIDVEFESGTTSTGVSINTSGVAKTEYYTHPAFRDGSKVYKTTAYDQSGWDKELSGFWVSKFEDFDNVYDYIPSFNGKIYDVFDFNSWANDEYASIVKADYHAIKNTEWGAIAYLSQSKYGKMGNNNFTGANKEIYINSNSNLYTGRSGGSPNAGVFSNGGYRFNGFSCKTTLCNGTQDQLKGAGASTTGTVYGIYDFNGGTKEHVAANYNKAVASSGMNISYFQDTNNKKYYDSYTIDKTYILGDALEETKGWYNDSAEIFDTDNPFLTRGGAYNEGASAGMFNYVKDDGGNKTPLVHRAIMLP